MLNKIIHFSLHNRILVLVASVLLLAGGIYTSMHTEVDVFPDLNAPTVVIMTEAGGMAAEEVEQLVTFPVETAVNGATGVRRVRSSSTNGFSVVWVEFDWDTEIYRARQIVSEKLAVVSESLPPNVGKPTLGPQSSILGEMLIIGLTADSTSLLDLRTLADWTIRPRLLSTGGVAQVAVLGGDVKEYQIALVPERMKHYNISLDEVMAATRDMNLNANGGVLYEYGNEYIVRGVLSTGETAQLGRALIRKATTVAAPVFLEDIAEVRTGAKEPKLGTASEKGKPAVLLTVTKQPATGTLELTDKLEAALNDLKKNLPPDVHVSTDVFRQSRFIESSIGNVKQSLFEGGLFVVIVLFLFLANVRTTMISLVTLPLSLIVSLVTLHCMGLTINTMSLGGLAIAIGSLVDDAIVDVENVYKRLHENRRKPLEAQLPILEVVFNASKEVRMPILNSTLIIVVSFVPLFFLTGMEGRMLIPLGIAFIVALAASTVVALTVTPVLCSYLLKGRDNPKTASADSFLAGKMKRLYGIALTFVLNHKKSVLGGTVGLFVAALVCFFTLGRSFLPPFNEGSFTVNISSVPGISLEESNRIGLRAEQLLLSIPEIKTVARKTGRAELDEHALGVNVSELEAPFELKERSRSELTADVREKLGTLDGALIEIGQPISHRIDAMLSGTKANIAVKLFGDDLNRLFSLGNEIKNAIADIDGIADLNVEQQIERPQLILSPRREMLAYYGITLPGFAELVRVCLAGEVVSQVYEKGKSFDVTVRVKDDRRNTAQQIRDLMVDTGNGQKVPMAAIAEVRSAMGPNTISRENVKRKIVVSANVADRDLRGVVNDIRTTIEKRVTLPEGYHVEYGGQFESEQAASRTLLIASLMSIAVIFLLLYHEFRSAKESAIVLINLPLALIGGVFALMLTTGEVSIPAIIGFISLFGIATRNGMLLISHYKHLQTEEGYTVRDSVLKGSLDRLNPILMTALSSALALIPLAVAGDLPGNEIQSPMAKVILGGLLTSTFLNGFIIPTVYLLMQGENGARKHEKTGATVPDLGTACTETWYNLYTDSVQPVPRPGTASPDEHAEISDTTTPSNPNKQTT
jgi:CzcA family heavy metal efflux pump